MKEMAETKNTMCEHWPIANMTSLGYWKNTSKFFKIEKKKMMKIDQELRKI